MAGERHAFLWHADHGLQDLGPGQARNTDEVGDIAGCRGTGDATRATVWHVGMSSSEDLIGFRSLTGRRRADVDAKASRAVLRRIDVAQKALEHRHGRVAGPHLERALEESAALADAGALATDWAASLQRIGASIVERL